MATNDLHPGSNTLRSSDERGESANQSTIWTVFLSSTIGDFQEYRREVQDALLKHARVVCFLSEDWINEYGPTVPKCREELDKAHGYIGIFGFWYGSIPPRSKQSITHMEFIWALEKWGEAKPSRMAVLMPKGASEAERQLKQKAALLIPTSKAQKKKHDDALKAFREQVTQTWNTVTWFNDEHELREMVIVFGLQWRLGGPLEAAKREREPPAEKGVADDDLGLLGRAEHLDHFKKILNRVALWPDVPAVAMLIHGDEDSGQRVFLLQLLEDKKLLRGARPPRKAMGRPQLEQYDVKALVQWAGDVLGVLPEGKESGSIEELAELIHQKLQEQQLVFVLDQVWRLSGGLTTWYEKFWQPLYARLAELRLQNKHYHRLVAIVVDYEDQSAFDSDKSSRLSEAVPVTADDYARLWLLPVLRDISSGDLVDWFDEMDVQDDATGRRATLASLALKNAKGEIDGTPSRVFERLRQSSLFYDGEE